MYTVKEYVYIYICGNAFFRKKVKMDHYPL